MATILIADDDELNRKLLVTLLASHGHRVLQAADGAEALECLRVEACDLVVTDSLMPVMDGFELARRVRENAATARTKLMVYTAHPPGRQAGERATARGVDRILLKPCGTRQFLDAVGELLDSPAPPAGAGPS
jgi:CheY-like chemotaxis protein